MGFVYQFGEDVEPIKCLNSFLELGVVILRIPSTLEEIGLIAILQILCPRKLTVRAI